MNGVNTFDAGWTLVPVLVLIAGFVGGVLLVALLLWILYTIIWNGVRRGLEEYYGPGSYKGFTLPPSENARDDGPERPLVRDRRHRSGRLTR